MHDPFDRENDRDNGQDQPPKGGHRADRWGTSEQDPFDEEVEYRFNLDSRQQAARSKRSFSTTFLLGAGLTTILVLASLALVIGSAVNRLLNDGSTSGGGTSYTLGGTSSLAIVDVPPDNGAGSDDGGLTSMEIARQVLPSVVGITTYQNGSVTPKSTASGIVMSADGLIITNGHVVSDSSGVNVTLYDGSQYVAEVVGIDSRTDLAVLRIQAQNLVAATFGDSTSVVVGERVLAIGNPGGLSGSTTQGIISGINRQLTVTGGTETMNLLQTDAAINPGNSGGALVNRFGQVIGISSAKISRVDYEGVGFAIPISEAKPILDNLVQYGYVRDRAVLGITVVALNEAVGELNGLPSQGLYITAIEDYSPLPAYGVEVGDVIVKANGKELVANSDLLTELKKFSPGDTVSLVIYKKSTGRSVSVTCELVQAVAPQDADTSKDQ